MTLPVVITIFFGAILIIGAFVWQQSKSLKANLVALERSKSDLESKLQVARDSASKSKLELQKKEQSLTELREQTKAKLRKFGQKIDAAHEQDPAEQVNDITSHLEKTISALKLQLEQAEKNQEVAIKAAINEHDQSRKAEISTLNNAISQAKQEAQKIRTKLDGVKSSSHLNDLGIKVEELPVELVKEISYLHTQAQNNHNMCTVLQGKLNLMSDKYSEMQRKYFDVCRQLAMTLGGKEQPEAAQESAAADVNEPSAS